MLQRRKAGESMNGLNVKIKYQNTDVEVIFKHKWNMLSGYSGTGKTFLMQAIELFCKNAGIKSVYADFRFKEYDTEQIKVLLENADVVLLDNADLYLNDELFSWLKKMNKVIIGCMKDVSALDMENVYRHLVNYENGNITIEEF